MSERMTDERYTELHTKTAPFLRVEENEVMVELARARTSEKALAKASTRAAAELRHAYAAVGLGQAIDPNLVARAIELLERSTTA